MQYHHSIRPLFGGIMFLLPRLHQILTSYTIHAKWCLQLKTTRRVTQCMDRSVSYRPNAYFLLYVPNFISGGFRGGSWGSMEPPFGQATIHSIIEWSHRALQWKMHATVYLRSWWEIPLTFTSWPLQRWKLWILRLLYELPYRHNWQLKLQSVAQIV